MNPIICIFLIQAMFLSTSRVCTNLNVILELLLGSTTGLTIWMSGGVATLWSGVSIGEL
jgi:hypothetical protein